MHATHLAWTAQAFKLNTHLCLQNIVTKLLGASGACTTKDLRFLATYGQTSSAIKRHASPAAKTRAAGVVTKVKTPATAPPPLPRRPAGLGMALDHGRTSPDPAGTTQPELGGVSPAPAPTAGERTRRPVAARPWPLRRPSQPACRARKVPAPWRVPRRAEGPPRARAARIGGVVHADLQSPRARPACLAACRARHRRPAPGPRTRHRLPPRRGRFCSREQKLAP